MMKTETRVVLNGANVAALTVGGIFLSLALPLTPLHWVAGHFDSSAFPAFWYAYAVMLWAAFSAVIALIMLALKPRRVALYGLVSAVAFIVTMQTWSLTDGQYYVAVIRDLVSALMIPFFYWLFVRKAQSREDRSPPAPLEPGVSAS